MPELPIALSPELGYVALIFVLFVVPKLLQRWRLPAAITSLGIGIVCGAGFGLFQHDAPVAMLSTLGIVSLFLFAGLDVDVEELRRGTRVLLQHLAIRAAMLLIAGLAIHAVLGLEPRVAALVALALLTPSTGFILDSLDQLGLDERERFWIKSKAIATEILALGVMFVTLQSTSTARFTMSSLALLAMVLVLPVVFRAFAAFVVRHAPRSEFAFLLMIAVVCAVITRELGVYYLVGAFLVGMAAQRFRTRLPAMASEDLLRAVELFASFFVPFYFFHAGLEMRLEDFVPESLLYGFGFLVTMVPFRALGVVVHRRLALGERSRDAMRIAISMLPTLVFGLVIAAILRDRFAVAPPLFGGLILYTLVCTLIPALVLRQPIPEYATPRVLPIEPPGAPGTVSVPPGGAPSPGAARPD
jgi:Kef-type K+ transport system membrane component KefB